METQSIFINPSVMKTARVEIVGPDTEPMYSTWPNKHRCGSSPTLPLTYIYPFVLNIPASPFSTHHSPSLTMYHWVQAITAGLALSVNRLLPSSRPGALLKQETLTWIESTRLKYDIPGISLGIIASSNRTSHGWGNETHGFGSMDESGGLVDGDVHDLCPRVERS